jgi:hypothetical protein
MAYPFCLLRFPVPASYNFSKSEYYEKKGLSMDLKEHPYNPYTRARKDQLVQKICPDCGNEHVFWRETSHQHWHPQGNTPGELVEINGTVYIKCECGNKTKTRLKPMSASMPRSLALERGLIVSEEQDKKE